MTIQKAPEDDKRNPGGEGTPMKHSEDFMPDNRQDRRFLLDFNGISGKFGVATSVEPVNISMSGMCMRTDKWLKIGNEYRLQLKDTNRVISLFGVIKWSFLNARRPGSDKESTLVIPRYTSGVQFMKFSKKDKETLSAFIADHMKQDQLPLGGRGDGGMGYHFYIRAAHGPVQSPFLDQSIGEISIHRMFVFSINSMKIGEECTASYLFHGRKPLTVSGRIASCRPVTLGANRLFVIKIKFENVTDEDGKALQTIIGKCRNRGTHMIFTSEPGERQCETTAEAVAGELQELTGGAVDECSRKNSQYYIGDFT